MLNTAQDIATNAVCSMNAAVMYALANGGGGGYGCEAHKQS